MSQRALVLVAVFEAAVIVVLLVVLLGGDATSSSSGLVDRDPGSGGGGALRREGTSAEGVGAPHLAGDPAAHEPGETGSRFDLAADDPLRILVYGSLRTPDGKPVPGAYAALQDADGERLMAFGDGGYAFVGVPAGAWTLSCGADGYLPPDGQTITLAEGIAEYRLDLVFRKAWRIHVRLETPDGESFTAAAGKRHLPVDRLAVVATREPPPRLPPEYGSFYRFGLGEWTRPPHWDRDAQKALREGATGYIDLEGAPPIHLSVLLGHLVLATVEVTEIKDEATFVLSVDAAEQELASIRVRVLDAETDAPMENADLYFNNMTTTLGKDGERTLTHLIPGVHRLGIDAPDHAGYWTQVRIEGGRETDLGTIRLPRGRTIEGRVVDETGKPLGGEVQWRDPALMTFPQHLTTMRSYVLGDGGRFEISTAGPVEGWLLVMVDERPRLTVPVDTRKGDVEDLEIVLPKGTPVTLDLQMASTVMYLLTLRDEGGLPLWTVTVRDARPFHTRLQPGRYSLEIVRGDEVEKRIPLVVEETPVEVTVSP